MHGGTVPALWAATAVLALLDALVAPDAHGPVYVATNVFLFFAALLLLAHAASKAHRQHAANAGYAPIAYAPAAYAPAAYAPAAYAPAPYAPAPYAPAAYTPPPDTCPNHTQDYSLCCVRTTTHPHIELTHVFIHLLCLAYVRTACWFEFRALAAWLEFRALHHAAFPSSTA